MILLVLSVFHGNKVMCEIHLQILSLSGARIYYSYIYEASLQNKASTKEKKEKNLYSVINNIAISI